MLQLCGLDLFSICQQVPILCSDFSLVFLFNIHLTLYPLPVFLPELPPVCLWTLCCLKAHYGMYLMHLETYCMSSGKDTVCLCAGFASDHSHVTAGLLSLPLSVSVCVAHATPLTLSFSSSPLDLQPHQWLLKVFPTFNIRFGT